MQKKHQWMLWGVVVSLAACGSPAEVEETPPPAATVGDESAPEPSLAAVDQPPPEPDAPPPSAAPVDPPAPEPPSVGAVISLRVKDYDAWKTAFDAGEAMRIQGGVVGHGVSLDADKKNTVSVYLGARDLEQLEGFVASKERKAAMKAAGVIGKPKVTYMTHTENKPASGQPALTAMVTHKVKDYAAWKAAYDAHADKRAAAGVIGASISQDPDNANLVYVYLQGSDAEKLRAFAADKDLKAAMQEAGVKGKPTFAFMTPQEMKFYPPAPPPAVTAPQASDAPPAPPESAAPAPAAAPKK